MNTPDRPQARITYDTYYRVLRLFVEDGKTQAQIAREVGISAGTCCDLLKGGYGFATTKDAGQPHPDLARLQAAARNIKAQRALANAAALVAAAQVQIPNPLQQGAAA